MKRFAFTSLLLAAGLLMGCPSEPEEPATNTLYERLGGAIAIAAVVDEFSERVAVNDTLNQNPALLAANGNIPIAGLKFLRTLYFCDATGGPFTYTGRPLMEAHRDLGITEAEFAEVGAVLKGTLDDFQVPEAEQQELLQLIIDQQGQVVQE